MKKILFIMACFIIIAASCSKDDINKDHLTYNDFQNHLTSKMTYEDIIKTFGTPVKDMGSGIHIYVYELKDLTEVWIGYADQIIYAKHVDDSQQELHVII